MHVTQTPLKCNMHKPYQGIKSPCVVNDFCTNSADDHLIIQRDIVFSLLYENDM